MLKETKINFKQYDVGVIVGRFQTHMLHEAHKELINTVCSNHNNVVIFLGVSAINYTKNNPLDYITREKMIKDLYPNILVIPIKDEKKDTDWSITLDRKIDEIFPEKSKLFYGGRDSFIKYYTGKYMDNTYELEQNVFTSATKIREELRNKSLMSSDFRAGICYAVSNQYDITYPTIDVAILSSDGKILLGKKHYEDKYRFIGGFIDRKDESAEITVRREVMEEAGNIEIDNIQYVASSSINDWRYKNEKSGIMSFFYTADYIYGKPEAADDLAEVKWFKIDELINYSDLIIEEHRHFFEKLVIKLKDKK